MQYKTYAQIKIKVERELDIEVEEFVQPEEFLGYVNDGIDEAEAIIHNLGLEAEYFKTRAFLPLVDGQEDYSLPANIYADKIRSIIYKRDTRVYTIDRMRFDTSFEEIELAGIYAPADNNTYQYIIRNDSAADGVKLQLVPASNETSSQNVRIWYIRSANDMVDDSSICDLPEIAMQFLYQYIKFRVYEKEVHPNQDSAGIALEKIKTSFISTLENQVPDNRTEIMQDVSLYEDMS